MGTSAFKPPAGPGSRCSRLHAWRRAAAALFAVASVGAAALPPTPADLASSRPAWMLALANAAQDHPHDAMAQARLRLRAGLGSDDGFWAALAVAQAQVMLEQTADAVATLREAATALQRLRAATPAQRLWLEVVQLQADWPLGPPEQGQARLRALRQQVGALADADLACELTRIDLTMLLDINSLDEAWLSAEALERCGRATDTPERTAAGVLALGILTRRGQGGDTGQAEALFTRANQVLGPQPARMARSIIAWEHGIALGLAGRRDEALAMLGRAQAISREIGDGAGVAAAAVEMATLHLQRQDAAQALPLLRQARALLTAHDTSFRLPLVAQRELEAMALLRHPEIQAAVSQARRWDQPSLPPTERARLVRAMAGAYAAQGQWAQAWTELRRSESLAAEGKRLGTDVQVLRLQARYAAAQRDAENAELRHRSVAAGLALDVQSARQRALWAALATLGLLTAGVLAWTWRALRQRRSLADLALRDDLTGQPNRRAVTAYAEAQFAQARRLGVPLSVAMIDLDHFKQVNDSLGHAGGDAVLRALVAAGRSVLRGQDRLGRWGGEEWLLVMPGTSVDELPAVFERLRSAFAAMPAFGVPGRHGCSFSMGGAEMQSDTTSLDALVAQADAALYRAKADGRNCLRTAG